LQRSTWCLVPIWTQQIGRRHAPTPMSLPWCQAQSGASLVCHIEASYARCRVLKAGSAQSGMTSSLAWFGEPSSKVWRALIIAQRHRRRQAPRPLRVMSQSPQASHRQTCQNHSQAPRWQAFSSQVRRRWIGRPPRRRPIANIIDRSDTRFSGLPFTACLTWKALPNTLVRDVHGDYVNGDSRRLLAALER
jgi:hypothetical protein